MELMSERIRQYIMHHVDFRHMPDCAEFLEKYSSKAEITEEDEGVFKSVAMHIIKRAKRGKKGQSRSGASK